MAYIMTPFIVGSWSLCEQKHMAIKDSSNVSWLLLSNADMDWDTCAHGVPARKWGCILKGTADMDMFHEHREEMWSGHTDTHACTEALWLKNNSVYKYIVTIIIHHHDN